MRRRSVPVFALLARRAHLARCAAAAVLLVVAPAAAGAQITVGRNVQVSRLRPAWWHDEVMLGVDPTDPRRMIACSVVLVPEENRRTTIVYSSADGGGTWRPTLASTYAKESADPVCLFGPGGKAYYGVEIPSSPPSPPNMVVHLYTSVDGGQTWPAKTALQLGLFDRWFLAADTTKTSPYYGRLYSGSAASTGSRPVADAYGVMSSSDNGVTWSGLAKQAFVRGNVGNCDLATDGMLACVFVQSMDTTARQSSPPPAPLERRNAWLRVVTSSDGGRSLSPMTTVDMIAHSDNVFSAGLPQIAIDRSTTAFRNRLYAVWEDARNGRTEIWLAYSTDRGKTWSPARRVSDDLLAPGPNPSPWHSMPHVAVTPDGMVGVLWYDRRDDPTNLGYLPRFAASFDGGETFAASVPVSEQPHRVTADGRWPLYVWDPALYPVRVGAPAMLSWGWYGKHLSGGETLGFEAEAPGRFRALWTDNRTGVDQVWTAPIVVEGQALPKGAPELSRLRDVSDRVVAEVTRWVSDGGSDTIALSVRLRNKGPGTIIGPIKARVVDVGEMVGPVFVANADNGVSHVGAVWDFTPVLSGGRLQPGQVSGEKTLRLRWPKTSIPIISSATPLDAPRQQWGAVTVRFRVLAGAIQPAP